MPPPAIDIRARKESPIATNPFDTDTALQVGDAERALLVAVEIQNATWAAQDSLEELARLAETVDVEVVGSVTQKLKAPHRATYVGKGKVEEIKDLKESLEYTLVMVDGELSPAQQRNLETALEVKIIDRTAFMRSSVARESRPKVAVNAATSCFS